MKMRLLKRLKSKQKGIGLLELMLALGIIALLLVMATRYYNQTRRAEMINDASRVAAFTLAGAKNWKGGRMSYEELTSYSILNDTGLAPDGIEVKNGSSGELPRWQGCPGEIDISWDSSERKVRLVFSHISKQICNGLKARMNRSADPTLDNSDCTASAGSTNSCDATWFVYMNDN